MSDDEIPTHPSDPARDSTLDISTIMSMEPEQLHDIAADFGTLADRLGAHGATFRFAGEALDSPDAEQRAAGRASTVQLRDALIDDLNEFDKLAAKISTAARGTDIETAGLSLCENYSSQLTGLLDYVQTVLDEIDGRR